MNYFLKKHTEKRLLRIEKTVDTFHTMQTIRDDIFLKNQK